MTDNVSPSAPIRFEASFPCEARFRDAMADFAARLADALAAVCPGASDVGPAILRGFDDALQTQAGGDLSIRVDAPAGGGSVTLRMTVADAPPTVRTFA